MTEPTFERLTRFYAAMLPSLCIISDEGGQFLGGHAMNSDNRQRTLAALNDLWQGNPIRRTRAGDGHSTLHERRLAIHLMVQPAAAYSFMADPLTRDIGFLPRFLICEPPNTIGTRLHANRRQDNTAHAAFSRRLRGILAHPFPMDDQTRDLQPLLLSLSEAARALLITFADDLELRQAPGRDLADITAYASKAAEQAARIARVLTLWSDLEAKEVDADTMAGAITLAQFYLGEAVRLGDAATESAETRRAEALRRWLGEDWGNPGFVLRYVMRLGPNSLRESSKMKAAIRILEAHGWIVKLPEGVTVEGVAKKESWRVVTNK